MALDPKATASAASSLATPGGTLSGGLGAGRIARLAVIVGKPAPKTPASEAPPEGGRDVGQAIVVCTAPDVCKTPIGSSTPPIPYQITGKLGDDANTSQNVFLTGLKAFKFDSVVTNVKGDEPGAAKGIKSGTVGDIAEPKTASTVVRVNGQWLVRDGDTFWMNKRNTVGELNYKKDRSTYWPAADASAIDDSEAEALLARAQADGAAIDYYETDQEKTGKARLIPASSMADYASLVRTTMGEKPILLAQAQLQQMPNATVSDARAGAIPQTRPAPTPTFQPGPAANDNNFRPPAGMPRPGGSTGMAGKAAGAAGKMLFLLWIVQGAPMPGDNLILGKAAAKRVLEGINPQTPQEQAIYDQAVDHLAEYKASVYDSWWPTGSDKFDAEVRKAVEDQIAEERTRAQQQQQQPSQSSQPQANPAPEAGVRVEGQPDPCNPGAHGKNNCPPGQDSHHIIADYIMRLGTRREPGARLPGAPSLDDGPAICLTEKEHARVHQLMDGAIKAAGGDAGTVSFEKAKQIAYEALGAAKKDCKGKFEAATDEYFKKVPEDALARAFKTAPKAIKDKALQTLESAWEKLRPLNPPK
ncbi:DUF4150 domain-containing protein [Variovorax sp. AFSI2.2]|uniref:DUF4150 domain-containing protein n=1 Tax=Variovorax sp. AFSI2.2 TaxID=3384160 RepID=UPI003EB6FEC9